VKTFSQKFTLGMLKINRLTGLQGKTGPETAGPVNRAVILCLHITALKAPPAHKFATAAANFRFIIVHAKANKHLPWHSALGISVDGSAVGRLYIPGHQPTQPAAPMHVTWMSVLDRCKI